MKEIITTVITAIIMACAFTQQAAAAIGDWKIYMAYSDIQQIEQAGNLLFVRASNSLYVYNKNDQSIKTYDKNDGLNGVTITNIAWNTAAKRLVIIYEDSNIDLLDAKGNIINVGDLYNKSMTDDKTINDIACWQNYAFLATNFGGVKLDVAKAEISETYLLGYRTNRVGVVDGRVYLRQYAGWKLANASLTDSNLQDPAQWTLIPHNAKYYAKDLTAYNENIDLVKTLKPGGPQVNYIGNLRIHSNKLYTSNGVSGGTQNACIQVWDGNDWTSFDMSFADQLDHKFRNIYSFDFDPYDDNHLFAGAMSGLYEFRNGQFVKEYNCDNSELEIAYTVNGNRDYVIVQTVKYDKQGNLWLANNIATSHSLFSLKRGSGQLTSLHKDALMEDIRNNKGMEGLKGITFDKQGTLWMVNDDYRAPSLIKYLPEQDTVVLYQNFVNQDGQKISELYYVRCTTTDSDGNRWIGTNVGPLYIAYGDLDKSPANISFIQPKVARNDGTNLADYLLSGVDINTICIDGAGRKWFGTTGSGLYLISQDNQEQIQHYTKDNSPLISNDILDLALDPTSGELYISTTKGLCSLTTDVTAPSEEMNKDNVYAYPNPVDPDYSGMITISGLSLDADIKITTATGYLVNQGRSNGGSYQWDGRDLKGKRVASGVYNVISAKSDGSKGTVCKVAIIR